MALIAQILINLPWEGKARWQSTYEIPADTNEIIFNSDYCITELSKTAPGIPGGWTGTAPSSGTSPLDTFRLHSETEMPAAAAPANKGLHPYVDPLNSGSGFGYHPVEASPEQPLLDFDFSYF